MTLPQGGISSNRSPAFRLQEKMKLTHPIGKWIVRAAETR
jgi:hypothetical protein